MVHSSSDYSSNYIGRLAEPRGVSRDTSIKTDNAGSETSLKN